MKNIALLLPILLFGVSCKSQSECVCSARLIPFYAKTRFMVTIDAIKDTSSAFDFENLPIDEAFLNARDQLELVESSVSNARSYYRVDCSNRSYDVILDRSKVIYIDGVTYAYDSAYFSVLASLIPEEQRWRYVP